jgi:hypothetical protein
MAEWKELNDKDRLILTNQKLILHGLRALLWRAGGMDVPALEMQSAMTDTQDFIDDHRE